jgi:polyphosphate kinase 2
MRNLLTEVSKMKNMMGLQEADKPKYSPEVKSLIEFLKDNKVYSAQIQKFINKIEEYSKEGLVDFGLLTRGIGKTLKLKGSKDINIFEFFKQLTKSLEKRKTKKEVVSPEEEPSILDKDIYKKEIFFLQVELLKLQEWLKQTGKTVIIVFEGRDSAGKGSTIKKFTENLNPRYYKVIALGIPTPDERKNWWDRYSNQIERGKINFFDRSWYNRGLVEPVMGYGSSEEYEDFMDNVQDFEESLVVDGDYLFKLWFSIDKETQAKRFDFRQKSPLKYWKYSENDEKMQDVWEKFTEYKQKLFDKTSTVNHPWVVLDSNDKKISGLNSIRYVLQNIPYTNKDEDVLNKDFPEAMTVLRPNINEQSVIDDVKKIAGVKPNQNSDTFWGDVNKLTSPGNKSKDGVLDTAMKMVKTKTQINKTDSINKDNLDEVIGCSGYGPSTPQFKLAKVMAQKEGWNKTDNNGKGSRSYRNNNPGNLDYQDGFKSVDKDVTKETTLDGKVGRFAKFSSPCLGSKALIEQKIIKWSKGEMPDYGQAPNYNKGQKPTLKQFMYTYAPPTENDTTKYIKFILQSLNNPKFNENTLMKDILKI